MIAVNSFLNKLQRLKNFNDFTLKVMENLFCTRMKYENFLEILLLLPCKD